MEAWVTLVTNDNYALGALTLAASLRRVKSTKKMVIMITNTLSKNFKNTLEEVFDEVILVNTMDSGDVPNLTLLERPELGITFTKVWCWTLTQYTKCVFLDADTLVIQNCDELFDREELSASPDVGWPDCFNSGVFVFRPNMNTYSELVSLAGTMGSFDGGDQGLLNTFFSDWATKDISKHLPFTYNMVASASYSYLPAYKQFGQQVKIVHFIGSAKPWLVSWDAAGEPRTGFSEKNMATHLKLWWQIFSTEVKPVLEKNTEPDNTSLPCMISSVMGSSYSSSPPPPPQDSRQAWESGTPDYGGTASFANILEKINKTLNE